MVGADATECVWFPGQIYVLYTVQYVNKSQTFTRIIFGTVYLLIGGFHFKNYPFFGTVYLLIGGYNLKLYTTYEIIVATSRF